MNQTYLQLSDKEKTWKIQTEAVRDCFWQASQEERIKWAKINPAIFGEQYIKPYINKWNTNTADHQYFMLYQALTNDNIIIHVPIEHAKSTWFSLVLPLWFIINDRNTYGAILSNTATQAKLFLSMIKHTIIDNELFKKDFPEIQPDYDKKWTESEIFIKRDKDKLSKDPTIMARGTGNAILGARFEWVIGDDLCDLDNSSNETMRNKVLTWFNEIVDSRVIDGGRKILLGTLQHAQDLLCNLADNVDIYKYINLKALDINTNTPLWGQIWSVDRILKKKKTIGVLSWNKVMQNDRTAKELKVLNSDDLNYYGSAETYNFNIFDKNTVVYIGIDPAIADDAESAKQKKLDEFAIVVVGLDKISKLMFLWDYWTGYLTFPQQLKKINETYIKYMDAGCFVKRIGIESVSYQKALAQQALLLETLPPIESILVGKRSKQARIEAFGVYHETKRFYIKPSHNKFIEEYENYTPGGKSPNLLDACAITVTMIRGFTRVSDIQVIQEKKVINVW